MIFKGFQMKKVGLCLLVFLFLAAPGLALASTTSDVGGATVEQGKQIAEVRFGFSEDESSSSHDERLRMRVHYDRGLTDFYAIRFVVAGDKRKDDSLEMESLGIENRFYLLRAKEHGFDLGLRLNYTYRDGDKKPDTVSVRMYQQIPLDKTEIRFNEIFDHEVGEDATGGVLFTLGSQVTRALPGNRRLGIEMFNILGRLNDLSGYEAQDHSIGPVLKGKFGNGFSYETAYRAGISSGAADHNFRLMFTKNF